MLTLHRSRRRPLALIALLWLAGAAPGYCETPPEGFTALFNGRDFTHWCGRRQVDPREWEAMPAAKRALEQAKDDADFAKHWRVEEGVIVNDGHGVFCTTKEDFEDFELLVDWKMVAPATDSGVYVRGVPQVQIWDPNNEAQHDHGAQLGSGGLWNNAPGAPGKDPLVKADNPVGEWNTLGIRVVGDRVIVHLNDKLVVDNAVMHNYWDREKPLYRSGPIQLQTHGGEMRFRNVFIRRLDADAPSEPADAPNEPGR